MNGPGPRPWQTRRGAAPLAGRVAMRAYLPEASRSQEQVDSPIERRRGVPPTVLGAWHAGIGVGCGVRRHSDDLGIRSRAGVRPTHDGRSTAARGRRRSDGR